MEITFVAMELQAHLATMAVFSVVIANKLLL
jgi:hypothetical protein